MKISEHLDLSELIRSESAKRNGISNMPTDEHIANFKVLAEKIFEPIRNNFRCPIIISSGYRSAELNKCIGGASSSQHCKGQAIDIDMDGTPNGVTNNDIFHWVIANLQFTQLIAEYPIDKELSWVHIGYDANKLKNEVLICTKVNGKPNYVPYKGNEHLLK